MASPGLDLAALQALGSLVENDLEGWRELLDTHLEHSQKLATQIELAVLNGDLPALERAAHTLKSSSALFGATELAAACAGAEHYAHLGNPFAVEFGRDMLRLRAIAHQQLLPWRDQVP